MKELLQQTESQKKQYTKPWLKRVNLRAEEAVLGNCKISGSAGPASVTNNCVSVSACVQIGS